MSRKIGLALMVAAGLPVCAARAAEVSSGAEFAAVLAGGESEIALTRDIMLASGIGTQTAENMALDGNGHSLTGNNDLNGFSVAKGKTLSAANVGGKYTVSDTAPADGSIYAEFTDTDGQKKYAVSAGGFERLLGSGVASTGVLSNKGMLEVADSAFVGNQVGYGGAGVHNAGLITRLNADFLKNEGSWGAALYNAGVITAFEGDFIGNTAEYYGGAVFNMGEIGTMGGFYAGNTATPYGGALFNGKDAIGNIGTIEKIIGIFSGNNAKYGSAIFNDGEVGAVAGVGFYYNGLESGYMGGAIYNSGTMDIRSSEFAGNASSYGGAVASYGTGEIADSVFRANRAAQGGAIYSNYSNGGGNIANSVFEGNEANSGGAIYNRTEGLVVTNSSFTDNTAAGYGGALYVRAGMTIRADGDTAAFSGNTADGESNAAYVMAGQTLTLETLNGGNIVSDDGFTGSEDGWTLVLSGDDSGEITLNGEIKNAEIVSGIAKGNGLTGIADAAVTNIAGGNLIGNGTNSLAMNGGLVNIQSLGFERLQLKNLALNGGKLDIYNVNVDLENVKMGEMSAEEVSGDLALVEVKSLDVLSDGEAETTHVMFADNNILAGQVASQIAESAGPVYNYDVEYLPENGEFTFTRRERKDKFNPEVLESGMAVVASIGVLNDEIYSRVLADADRTAFRKGAAEAGGGAWVKPFASSDNLEFKNYHGADARFNGVIAGADSRVKTYGNGVAAVYSAYGAYADGEAEFAAGKIEQNVWYLGAGANFYKGSAFWGITANAGYARKKANDFDKNGKFDAWLGGIGAKFGYNCVLGNGWTVQPNFYATYTYADAEDYTTGKNAKVAFDGLSMYELAPGLKIEKAFNDELQVYAKGRYVHTGTGLQHVTANGVHLPDMEIEPYAEYGLGFESSNGDASLFAEVMRRDGGRTGWNGLAGLKINF